MFITFKRIFKVGWKSFFQDGGAAAATIFIMVLTISLITSLFLLKGISLFLIEDLQEKVDISVYFKEDSQELDILNVQDELSKIPEVKSIKYVSKEQALQDFIQRHQQDSILMRSLEEVGRNPFLASLNVRAFEASEYQGISNFLEKSNFENLIEKVDYHQRKPVIERIFSLTAAIERFGIGLSIGLALLSFLVVFSTTRLAIINSKEEIKIQRLVGASNWFVRGPFLVQGTISGILATLICLLIFIFISWFLSPRVEIFFPGLTIWGYFTANFWILLLIQVATGIGLGVVSSTIAIRKYLKV